MAVATKTYTFLNGQTAQAVHVNQNFDDVLGFLNTQAVHRDGSTPFSATPVVTGAGADTVPPGAGSLAHKGYVDNKSMVVHDTALAAGSVALNAGANTALATSTMQMVQNRWYMALVQHTFGVSGLVPAGPQTEILVAHELVIGGGQFGSYYLWARVGMPQTVTFQVPFMWHGATSNQTVRFQLRNASNEMSTQFRMTVIRSNVSPSRFTILNMGSN